MEKKYTAINKEGGSSPCPDKELLLRERPKCRIAYQMAYVHKRGGDLHLHMPKISSESKNASKLIQLAPVG